MITTAKLGLRVTRVIIRKKKKKKYGREGHMDKVKFKGHTGYYKDKRDKKAKTPTKSKS